MKELIMTLIIFIIIYLFYLIFVILNKKKLKKFENNIYAKFLIIKFKLNKEKINIKKIAHIVALCNSFILSITFLITEITNNFIYKMILGCATLILLQLLVYYVVGNLLKRRDENV